MSNRKGKTCSVTSVLFPRRSRACRDPRRVILVIGVWTGADSLLAIQTARSVVGLAQITCAERPSPESRDDGGPRDSSLVSAASRRWGGVCGRCFHRDARRRKRDEQRKEPFLS